MLDYLVRREEMSNCFMGLVFASTLDPKKLPYVTGTDEVAGHCGVRQKPDVDFRAMCESETYGSSKH